MSHLPWIDPLLQQVSQEYAQKPPQFVTAEPTAEDLAYTIKVASERDPFDTLHLKYDMYKALKAKKATLHKTTCSLGSILCVIFNNDHWTPPWKTWWRAVRLLSPSKQARVLVFAHPKMRTTPAKGERLAEQHINGGATFRCDPGTVVVYRKEEATRVMIHELFHGNCSDPYHKHTEAIEASTEAWAEIILCAMAAKGHKDAWESKMKQQIVYSVQQAQYAQQHHHVYTEKDYAWRYLVGRLDVWRLLGLTVPDSVPPVKTLKSLRFTLCEPADV